MTLGIVTLGIFVAAGSPSAAADVLTLRDAIAQARAYSPDVKTLRAQAQSADAKTALALAPNEPSVSVNYNDMPSAFRLGRQASRSYQLSQPIAFPGKAFVARRSLDRAARAVDEQARALELQVALNVTTAYLGYAQSLQNLTLNDELRQSLERVSALAQRRYETGAISQVDLLNAEMAMHASESDANDLRSAATQARDQLNVLLGREIGRAIELEPFRNERRPIPELPEADRRMVAARHEIRSARLNAESAEVAYTAAKMTLLPDLQLTAGVSQYDEPGATPYASTSNLTTTYGVGVSLTIPLWGLFNERQQIIGAARDRAAARANVDVAVNQSRVQLQATLEGLRNSLFRIDMAERHLLPLSEQAVKLAMINYGSGKIDFQALLDAVNGRLGARRDYVAAVVNYQTGFATLATVLGEDL